MHERKILVIGATGRVGAHVLRKLAGSGAPVRALVRSTRGARRVRGIASEVVLGDLTDVPSLRTALTGVDHVFMVTPPGPEAEYYTGSVIEASASLSPHIVRLSTLGADPSSTVRLAHWHGKADRLLQRSGLDFTILRPHYFMQNLLEIHAETIVNESKLYAPMKDGAIAMVDVRDVAAVAAQCLMVPGHVGQVYDVTGPEAVSFKTVAAHLSEAAGRRIKYVDLTRDEALERLVNDGMDKVFAGWLVQRFGVFADGYAGQVSDVVRRVSGQQPRSFADFAHEFSSVWG